MDNFIKKIFDQQKGEDESVHSQFVKFSRGVFEERAMIKIKESSGNFTIATTSEYAKDLIMYLAEKLKDKKARVTGALISTINLDKEFEFQDKKMAMGVKKYMIDKEMSGNEILELCKKIEKAFFALSFSANNTELNIAVKSPKSAKGASSSKKEDAESKIDFIKIKTSDKELVKSLIFDKDILEFKKIEVKHTFVIDNIIIPPNEKDFAKIREEAKRKGKIIRNIDIDGKKLRKETEFEA
jgi:hypothetical protein